MRRVLAVATVLVAGAVVLAQSDQLNFRQNHIWLSDTNFSELEGFKNAVILNTSPRMILAKKEGEMMLCPMPTVPGGAWAPCWGVSD